MRYVLDTDHVSLLQRLQSPEGKTLYGRLRKTPPEDYATTCITFQEQTAGCNARDNKVQPSGNLLRSYELMMLVIETLRTLDALPFDQEDFHEFERLKSRGIRISTNDLRIAAICKSRKRTLLTRNRSDFGQVPGLLSEDWTKQESAEG